ncbi:MAG: AAA family ATPase [Pseudanabaenaceae cyanobacterium]
MIAEELSLLLRAKQSLIYVVTHDFHYLLDILREIQPQSEILIWDIARGWHDNAVGKGSPLLALQRLFNSSKTNILYVLQDIHHYLQPQYPECPTLIRELYYLQQKYYPLIICAPKLVLPLDLQEIITVVELPLPNFSQISAYIAQHVASNCLRFSDWGWENLVRACQGMSYQKIRQVLARAIAQKGYLDESVIGLILTDKMQIIRQTGLLDFIPETQSLKSIGGLDQLKQWVRLRRDAFSESARKYGIPTPKGVLLVGIQGTGKSLSAKTIAHEWQLPLLKLDTGKLFGEYVGESEHRTREMIRLAEAVAPCVLWIDEIDKAFGHIYRGIDGDSGTSRRVFASLITWMQEKTSPVFIVATANNVEVLPAELLRKGRFDEIFFLSLPNERERKEIFQVHLQRFRPARVREFDLNLLAKNTKHFSGAEIEQVIIDAMYRAFSRQEDFQNEDIIIAIEETVPLASIAQAQIQSLQKWAVQTGARTASSDRSLLSAE